jgi:glycosyltransferase involved in cell wall biosynthesis
MPKEKTVGVETKISCVVADEPFTATTLEVVGPHVRLERWIGLDDLIRNWRPTHIFVEADPATLLTREIIKAARPLHARVWSLTVENFERNFLYEGWNALCRGHVSVACGSVIAWWLLRSARRDLDQVFTISNDGTRVMEKSGFIGRITQIPLGFDHRLFYPNLEHRKETRSRLGLQTTTIAYFGRLVREKGVEFLLHALSMLKNMDWQFMMDRFSAYRTPYSLEIEQLIESLGLTARVVYFDACHREIPDYMNAADIVVLPSISTTKFKEQYGRVAPEAMACGKLVVGSRSGAIPELIGDAGYLVPEGDVDSLTQQIKILLTLPDSEKQSMQDKAVARAHQYFSIARQAKILHKMLNAVNS